MTTATKKRFPRLSSSAFEHPADRAALDAVKKIPLLDKIFTKLIELGAERALRITMMGRAVHVTPKQCPKIYKLFREACDILDMPEPDLFIISNPQPNAFTLGVERPIIAVHSGLIDLLTEEELMGVLGHELGHIKAGHVLYKTIAYFLLQILTMVFGTGGTLAEFGLSVALYDWSRKSELTADRAELLVTQNLETCIRTHMKLAGGSWSIYEQMDHDEFLRQADNYEDFDYSTLNKLYKLFNELWLTHPLPVYRAKEIKAWSEGKQFKEIMEGRYPTRDEDIGMRECPHCNAKISPSFFFCPDCGKSARV
ncbi:M48 family metalloprotease [Candidatus Obscuribacterales bacterium]|nr:M48 family metalloprotease [Candidatus Obscuribacterales bacterium]MBX3150452.1 M48 family metalloprotease [Candidatus Obscuribacterales bacterium]